MAAAVAAGLYTVAVPHTLTRDLDLRRADVVVDSLLDLSVAEAFERAGLRGGHRRAARPAGQSPTTVTGVSGTVPEA